ncbi:MAG TPA: aldo/keto reductase [Rhodopila sp.]|uniref:aldo/keto reductase n=1 Tax=Rhodopila sp. TaxID=2480087 RepID=UPI002B6B7BC1|nr:aldo/keto reductase [Rhodopila sp.]HVY15178.1 aldo/keto reductase [Rhodopila sp.]
MIRRSFGDGASISVLGIGCGRVGSVSNPVPMREIEATLEAAVDAGVTFFDTADIYGQGDSERTLGRLLRRHQGLFVVTKAGGRHSRYAGMIRLAKPILRMAARSRAEVRNAVLTARTASVVHEFSPNDLAQAVEASRRRLKLDQLHGLLLHDPSLETLRKPEIHDFLADILRRGHAARVGASVDSLDALDVAVGIPALSMVQVPLVLAESLPGTGTLETIRRRKIGLFAREVLRARSQSANRTAREAVAAAIAPDFITAAIVGASTRHHLNDLLPAAQ